MPGIKFHWQPSSIAGTTHKYNHIESNITTSVDSVPMPISLLHADPAAWKVILDFTSTDMSLPEAEN
ncbi:hypothetical protein PAXRUDRAFT_19327 [Paxillus rubicundulus Ve08.2h10]|uniref:Uncharacterized protein n=1 Tax=Paxillus rubicundulus Ve08.2h10 TaxID=930991 RepID=A0A0D0CVB1_9AGAM|nr:hypothetical protein PAXRUDRAFT_19327 [Paxillus rubicundulus Ve08.2h10]